MRSSTAIPNDIREWSELLPEAKALPGVTLDSINLDLANLRAATLAITRSPLHGDWTSYINSLLSEAVVIDKRLSHWPDTIPDSWLPARVSADMDISPTLQLYQDHCDVYKSLFVASLWNKSRLSQIETHFTVLTLLSLLPSTPSNINKQRLCQSGVQQLADDICASVPYYIGNRMRPGKAGEPGIHYPRVPGRPPIMDHYKTGPALGGWALMIPLSTVLRMQMRLREGQREWIAGQMARTARIYNLNMAKK